MSDHYKKIAQVVPPPPKYRQNKVQQTTVPMKGEVSIDTQTKSPAKFVATDRTAVKQMQMAILNFAKVAESSDITNLQGNQRGQMEGEQSRQVPSILHTLDQNQYEKELEHSTKNDKEYLGGSDPFGSFLTQQYVTKSPFAGRQYLNIDVHGNKNRQMQSMEGLNFRGLIDSIKRIGTPGSSGTEKSVDGVWQVRTNNALHNIYAVAAGLLEFANDMKVNVTGYDSKNLADFGNLIPKEYTDLKSSQEKTDTANKLTTHIKAITRFFESFKSKILDNKRMRSFIEQKKSFLKIPEEPNKSAKDVLDKDENDFFNTNKLQPIPHLSLKDNQGKFINVGLRELENLDSFKSLVQRLGKDPNNMDEVKSILQTIDTSLKNDFGF